MITINKQYVGSDKQLAYADALVNKYIDGLYGLINTANERVKNNTMDLSWIDFNVLVIEKAVKQIEAQKSAAVVIDYLKNTSVDRVYKSICSAWETMKGDVEKLRNALNQVK